MDEQEELKPEITVTMDGDLLLNARALALLGEAEGVGLLYHKEQHLVGVRAGGRTPIIRLPGENQWRIDGKGLWRHIGLIITATETYEAMCWPQVTREGVACGGSALFIDISDLAEESDAFRELFLETPAQYQEKASSGEREHKYG